MFQQTIIHVHSPLFLLSYNVGLQYKASYTMKTCGLNLNHSSTIVIKFQVKDFLGELSQQVNLDNSRPTAL